ncbi:hypothetical protein N781_16370 [Pontibacillus halophilus JSM 076056 = DSM 19796]|uniref:ABC-2 type transporter transmembrane domain-containing protein n=1 Tax=Pontibacillus halophilus JSM 076056 = DSM 19796 TaxID=1385510 RepID=A0A0A5GM75_9BACI|nr:ABC transporter permease [Pontibacillus halophilus]KGX92333.1 hypothetical protein N781_16370 [Pontibacillus halophilus JSM 076056 = DSM 19796]
MRNTLKVAKWEYKRNVMNKSFFISLLLTPAIFIFFAVVPSLFGGSDEAESETMTVYVEDAVGLLPEVRAYVEEASGLGWELKDAAKADVDVAQVNEEPYSAYLSITEHSIETGIVEVYSHDEVTDGFRSQLQLLSQPIKAYQMNQLGLTEEQLELASTDISFKTVEGASTDGGTEEAASADGENVEGFIPGAFALILFFAVVFTSVMIFQSASSEKKEKVSEIVLSSMKPSDLMQGKIVGYFWLGLTQVGVWLGVGVPLVAWRIDEIPIYEYLFVPSLLILVIVALLGYFLFAALFAGFGATVEDLNSASNFQGVIMMLPFLSFIFIGPVLNDPNGLLAKVGSFIPFTSPAVLIMRMAILEEWPWIEFGLAFVLLVGSVWAMVKIAGKIFEVGILMYGKNATPKEIWKWLRA